MRSGVYTAQRASVVAQKPLIRLPLPSDDTKGLSVWYELRGREQRQHRRRLPVLGRVDAIYRPLATLSIMGLP